METLDELGMFQGWNQGAEPRNPHLATMAVAAKHQVPGIIPKQLFRVRIMGENDDGKGGGRAGVRQSAFWIEGTRPQVAHSDDSNGLTVNRHIAVFIGQAGDAAVFEEIRRFGRIRVKAQ